MFIINRLFKKLIILFFKDNRMFILYLILFYQLYIILLQIKKTMLLPKIVFKDE
ncbi:hypothetical protein EV144_103151 [Flavobacterium sp. 270]|nr:hypothetical protein EV144_103151 [Flavobacterium sp. 270]